MKFEELLSSKYIMFAFIGLCAGILALTAVEVGDDFIPALVLSLVNLTAGVLVLVQLKRRFAPTAVLFFVLSVFSILFCLDGFFEELSEVFLILCGAVGFLRMADAPAVPDQPMVRLRPILLRNGLFELLLRFERVFRVREAQAVAHAENVRIHGDGVLIEPHGRNDVGRFLSHTRQRFEFGKAFGHLSAEFFHDVARGGTNVRRLTLVKTARKDALFQLFLREREHRFGRVVLFEKFRRHLVHPLVGTLCRQNDRDEQFVSGVIMQGGARARVRLA